MSLTSAWHPEAASSPRTTPRHRQQNRLRYVHTNLRFHHSLKQQHGLLLPACSLVAPARATVVPKEAQSRSDTFPIAGLCRCPEPGASCGQVAGLGESLCLLKLQAIAHHPTPHHTTPQRQPVDLSCLSPAIASRSPVPHLSTSTSRSVFPSFLPLSQYLFFEVVVPLLGS